MPRVYENYCYENKIELSESKCCAAGNKNWIMDCLKCRAGGYWASYGIQVAKGLNEFCRGGANG
eukprot:2414790-Rhodomonas_salina.1